MTTKVKDKIFHECLEDVELLVADNAGEPSDIVLSPDTCEEFAELLQKAAQRAKEWKSPTVDLVFFGTRVRILVSDDPAALEKELAVISGIIFSKRKPMADR